MTKHTQVRRIGLIGGSFNPVHYGHLRLAVEILEEIKPERLDVIPCATPPHKSRSRILPFSMRVDMLKTAFEPLPNVRINPLEGEREGQSYTVDTIEAYVRADPEARHFFVMGGIDLASFDTWKDWEKLPPLADLVVAARAGAEEEIFRNDVTRLWPDARLIQHSSVLGKERLAYRLPQGGHIMHLPLLRLDLSASLLRQRWLEGRSIRFFTPDSVRLFLAAHENVTRQCWG